MRRLVSCPLQLPQHRFRLPPAEHSSDTFLRNALRPRRVELMAFLELRPLVQSGYRYQHAGMDPGCGSDDGDFDQFAAAIGEPPHQRGRLRTAKTAYRRRSRMLNRVGVAIRATSAITKADMMESRGVAPTLGSAWGIG
jgi:hypothetical protein